VDYLVADESRARWLLLQVHPGPADPFRFEIDGYLDTVSNLDERNAAVHPELFAVEGHCSIDRINACPLAGKRQRQPLLLTPRIVKLPSNATVLGPVCSTFVE
jgi:hypothetical protein